MVDLIINILGPLKGKSNGHRKFFKVISTMFIVVMVSQLYQCIQAHQIPDLTYVQFFAYRLYISK